MDRWRKSSEDFEVFVIHRQTSFPVQSDGEDSHHGDCVFSINISPIVPESIVSSSSKDSTETSRGFEGTIDRTSLMAELVESWLGWTCGSGALAAPTTDWKTFSSDFDKSLEQRSSVVYLCLSNSILTDRCHSLIRRLCDDPFWRHRWTLSIRRTSPRDEPHDA